MDAKTLRQLQELADTSAYQGELLSGYRLAEIIQVTVDPTNKASLTAFLNECINIQDNEYIRALTDEQQRLQAIATAAALLSHLT